MIRRMIDILMLLAASVLLFSCNAGEALDVPMNEGIVLDISSPVTRLSVTDEELESTDAESFVNHIDVFIFEDVDGSATGEVKHYGRYIVNNASRFTLDAKRSGFTAGQNYHVYLIANSTHPQSYFENIDSFDGDNGLIGRKQEDELLHLTGLNLENAPKHFLMDAHVRTIINNGNIADETVVSATLRRAAAKIYVEIKAGEHVDFMPFTISDGSEGGLYYIRNLPYEAFLLSEAQGGEGIEAQKKRNTVKSSDSHFVWTPETDSKTVSLTTYVYPHSWAGNIIDNETCIVMNLPMRYTSGEENHEDYRNSWYKVHITGEDKEFKRNNYYKVKITLNRPGAISETVPVDVEEVYFAVEKWSEDTVNVGGDDKPKYLSVNKSELEMHNVSVDAKTLEFASSSPVSITVEDIHYYDKFGQKKSASVGITGTTEGGITGNITVNSPVPTNNHIRYFTLVITNQEGLVERVNVTQYPLEYITNQQGWYSYRSDFYTGSNNPTTYQYKGSRRVAANWNNGSWQYKTEQNDLDGAFFSSKVATMNSNGTSKLQYYYWRNNSNNVSTRAGNLGSLDNARMYHVQIKASSDKYTVGIPKLNADGFTDDGEDNAKLVSPSFMIASQLGATQAPTSVEQAERHCREYVEVHDPDNNSRTDNAVHYDNWRLPTEAEIKIIIDFQYVENAAMDEVLTGPYYWSATGKVANPGSGDTGTQSAVRCIRDVY